jgi:predicted transcriptional regulator
VKYPPESDIKKRRLTLGITQLDLAIASGVSQSTITKIETGKTKTSYETVVKLLETLEFLNRSKKIDRTASDIASDSPITVNAEDYLRVASELMRRSGFSQLPVMSGNIPVGSISERRILNLIEEEGIHMENLRNVLIRDVMGESFPVVSESTPLSTVALLMNDSDAVLVSRKGKIVSVITSTDLLKLI